MHIIERAMRDKMDLEMLEYTNSDQYLSEQNEIIRLINDFKSGLSKEKVKTLNELLDEINVSDSKFSYEAFFSGVISGMSIAISYNHMMPNE